VRPAPPLPPSKVAEATDAEWQAAFGRTAGTTFVQSPAWYEAARPLMKGYRLRVHLLDLPGGTAVLPLWERPLPGRRRVDVEANARGLYAMWLRETPLSADETQAVAGWLRGRTRLLAFRATPFPFMAAGSAQPDWSSFGPVQAEDTYVLDVAGGEDALWAGYAGGMRKDINKTRKGNVVCRVGGSQADWEGYADMYAETLGRRGAGSTSRYSRAFLLSLGRLPAASCRLWLAELDGRMLAGTVNLEHGRHSLAWHIATREAPGKLSPAKLVLHEAAVDAHLRGLAVYDLNVTGGHKGAEQWKALLGARALPAPFVLREPLSRKVRRTVRRLRSRLRGA
jgi:CelD/BcsL family acetyltransferase involved in cellulose biosynthesis